MLNIPEEIKQLFRQGSVKKNLRIHFPNGEREDITNENIIAESFSFEESICSEDTFKFGLCEASVVEFETFGVKNIKGCEIEVTLEVFNVNSWYSIPIGRYVVDSCKNQGGVNRRKIIAYSNTRTLLNGENIVEKEKQKLPTSENVDYSFDMYKYLISNRKNAYKDMKSLFDISEIEYEEKILQENIWTESGNGLYRYRVYASVVTVEKDSTLFDTLINVQYLHTNEFDNYKDIITKTYKYIYPYIELNSYYFVKQSNGNYIMSEEGGNSVFNFDNNYLLYPYYSGLKQESSTIIYNTPFMQIVIPTSVVVYDNSSGEEIIIKEYKLVDSCSFQRCDINVEHFTLNFSIKRKKKKLYPELNDTMAYLVSEMPDMSKPFEALLELNGLFGKASRNGGFDFFQINSDFSLYPSETLYPSEDLFPFSSDIVLAKSIYKSVLYDDFYTKPYSKVTCSYKNSETGENDYAEYVIVKVETKEEENYNIYDISDNYLINENTFTETQIMKILTNLAINLKNIQYMPSEVDLIGLPYLEAGDVVQVLTNDGGFEMLIFERKLTGIQSLSDYFSTK